MTVPVRTKVAYGEFYAVSGMTFSWSQVHVKVKNIAYDKSVQFHYRGYGDVWHGADLTFVGHYGNYDIFGTSGHIVPSCPEFAVRYLVDGNTYWDNNNGWNYQIATYAGVVGGNVVLKKATARTGIQGGGGFTFETSWLEGEIYVSNLSYHKRVGVRYTVSDWATWSDVDGTYVGPESGVASNISGIEIWKFKTPELNYDHAAETFKFAVYYEMQDSGPSYGTRFWDNNFMQDYTISKENGSTLE